MLAAACMFEPKPQNWKCQPIFSLLYMCAYVYCLCLPSMWTKARIVKEAILFFKISCIVTAMLMPVCMLDRKRQHVLDDTFHSPVTRDEVGSSCIMIGTFGRVDCDRYGCTAQMVRASYGYWHAHECTMLTFFHIIISYQSVAKCPVRLVDGIYRLVNFKGINNYYLTIMHRFSVCLWVCLFVCHTNLCRCED